MSITNILQRNRYVKISILAIIIITTLWASIFLYCTIGLIQSTEEIQSTIDGEDINFTDIETLGKILPKLARDLKTLEILTRPLIPIARLTSNLPDIGPLAGQIDPMLRYSSNVSQAGNLLYKALNPLIELTQSEGTSADISRQLYPVLKKGQPAIKQAAMALDEANLARQSINPSLLPFNLGVPFAKVDENFTGLLYGTHFLATLPDLLGSTDAPRKYLLLAQNKDELRATGGFISGIGLLQVAAGEIVSLEIGDSYEIDDYSKGYPSPPEPIHYFMKAGYWVPRDSNWSPDFPTAARKAQELYTLSTDQVTDGVIAFDQYAVRTMVDLFSPLQLEDFPNPITAENIELVMQQAWAPGDGEMNRDWWEHRKDFIPQLGDAILTELLNTRDRELLLQLGRNLLSDLGAGHILLYSNLTEAQTALSKAGFDNGIHPGDGDFLLLVDSNLGFNKTDGVVDREVSYFVDLSNPENISAMLIVHYTHTITEDIYCKQMSSYGSGVYTDMQVRCYWDYWRVYSPESTILHDSNQTPVPAAWLLNGEDWPGIAATGPGEANTHTTSGLFVMPTAQNQDLILQFILPMHVLETIDDGNLYYHLRIQKQAGLSHLPFVLQVKPPQGYQLNQPVQGWEQDDNFGFWIWKGRITSPVEIELEFSPTKLNPSH